MFDPYHKWLGIPPGRCPPTCYQLLALSPGEQEPDVIEAAAVRQSAYVRNFQAGPHAMECARILGEIAHARDALLNPARRAAYDAGLARLRRDSPRGAQPADEPVADDEVDQEDGIGDEDEIEPAYRSSGPALLLTVLIALACICGAAGWFAAHRMGGRLTDARSAPAVGESPPVPPDIAIPEFTADSEQPGDESSAPPGQNVGVPTAPTSAMVPASSTTPALSPSGPPSPLLVPASVDLEGQMQAKIKAKAREIMMQGAEHGNRREYPRALDLYEQAIKLDPDLAEAYLHRGFALYMTRHYGRSVASFDRAIRLRPDYADAYYFRSWGQAKLGKPGLAKADRRKALRMNPALAGRDPEFLGK